MEIWEELEEAFLEGFNARREVFGEDLCDIIKPTLTDGGATGDTLTQATVASNIPCFYEPAGANAQVVIGGKAYSGSHNLTMERTSITSLIAPDYKIKVLARTGKTQKIFEQPVIREGSFTPLIKVLATEVKQGYQQ